MKVSYATVYPHNDTLNIHACGVYYLRCQDGIYIGKTTRSFEIRWIEHIEDLAAQKHHNWKLQKAYDEGQGIICGILVSLETPEIIDTAEEILIDYYKNKTKLLNIEGNTQRKYGK